MQKRAERTVLKDQLLFGMFKSAYKDCISIGTVKTAEDDVRSPTDGLLYSLPVSSRHTNVAGGDPFYASGRMVQTTREVSFPDGLPAAFLNSRQKRTLLGLMLRRD